MGVVFSLNIHKHMDDEMEAMVRFCINRDVYDCKMGFINFA